ncbi:rRNA-processing protein Fcf1/Utp23, partial [Triangularia setosa]
FHRLSCNHKGTYVDDCIVEMVTKHRCCLVMTNDRQLRQRVGKIPGVPLVAVGRGKLERERLPGVAV